MKINCLLFTLTTLTWFTTAKAQVKIGANPASIGGTSNLEVEAANGNKTIIQKDNGNVGIGTTSPGAKLEVNNGTTAGAVKLVDGTQGIGKVLTSDANGVGTWQSIGSTVVYKVAATQPVDVIGSVDSLDLGLSKTITIPAGRNAVITVFTNVPAGLDSVVSLNQIPNAYIGTRLKRNGIDTEEGSRKFTLAAFGNSASTIVPMSHVVGQFTETIVAANTDQLITYKTQGYVEQWSISNGYTPTYRFNMWAASGDNFDWGRATMVINVTYY